VGDDYMNYRLAAAEYVGETSVLIIRREGRYTAWFSEEPTVEAKVVPVVMERRGITLFAWNRGMVLEDRFLDRVIEANDCLASDSCTTSQVVTRLIRSCPETIAKQVHSPDGRV
jgi:hypothetical protein